MNLTQAENEANEIAAAVRATGTTGKVAIRYNRHAETYAVRVTLGAGNFWDLLMPASGSLYPLFHRNQWAGLGVEIRQGAPAADVARALINRIY